MHPTFSALNFPALWTGLAPGLQNGPRAMRCTGWSLGYGSRPATTECSRCLRQGAGAEYVVCNQGLLIEKPARLSWVEAASIPENYITGAHGNFMPGYQGTPIIIFMPHPVFQPIKHCSSMVT